MKKINLKNKRLVIQITILALVIISALAHELESIFHYICPTCGVTSIYQFLVSPTIWATKVKSTLGIVIGLVVIFTIIFGPVLCGFICPFGTIQDIAARLGKKMFRAKYNNFVSKKLNSKLKYLRYITLVGTVLLTSMSSVMLIESLNPYHVFLGIFNSKTISIIGVFILSLVILTSLFVQRPWCRYLCPYGALLGLSNKFKIFRVVKNENSCIGCKKCDRECPMGIEVHTKNITRDLSCISCLDCVKNDVCPKLETLLYTSRDIEEIEDLTEESYYLAEEINRLEEDYNEK
ncbi:4Fe-4S binding protein [Romboutsia sp.]|uniref:4Fe-4S binding protein n=1 Tax=Romboutsia sp. TaxID=1965302 RepID=UPI003F38F742